MCMYFHDSDLSVWYKIVSILYESGFDYMGQTHIKKKNTLKNIISPKKSLTGDSILFFRNTNISKKYEDGKESIEEIEVNIIQEAKHMIKREGALGTTELYDDGLMEILIQNGWIRTLSKRYKSLVELFELHLFWDKSVGKWRISKNS